MKKMSLRSRVALAAEGGFGAMRSLRYSGLALLFAFLFATLIYLIINWGVYGNLLLSPLSLGDKGGALSLMMQRMGGDMVTTMNGALLLVVSVLQGVSLSLLVFTMKHNRRFSADSAKAVGGGGIAAIAAALGLGCVPCGTSIILPIVSLFFSSSAYAAANVASTIVLAVAFVVTIYSLYKLGFVAYPYTQIKEDADGVV